MAKGQPSKEGQSFPLTKENRVGVIQFLHRKVCEMQDAKSILGIIRERGRKGLPLERVYRQLFNPDLYLQAYGKIYRNAGAMTKGVTGETVDGMSLEKIETIIEALRNERYHWHPARRVSIEKPHSTKKRPLGIPVWSDKVLQEVIRLLLDAYYEPQFSDHSHGFRPERGCHTALRDIYYTWRGTIWFIEGDISQCFDSLDHEFLLATLQECIHDGRFINLIRELLKAGYLEEWKFNKTLSGSPQGGIVSPILSNIYLDRFDTFVEETLIPAYTRGDLRKRNPEYTTLHHRSSYLRRKGKVEAANELKKQFQHLPTQDPNDPNYRRLKYVRYADDFLLGFIGPRSEAEEIKERLGQFLREELKLQLSETKTLITHARSKAARFLGYEIHTLQDDEQRDRRNRRCINGSIGLRVPRDVLKEKCQRYMRHGKAIHRPELLQESDFTIIASYQAEYRGVVEYYRLAYNLHSLHTLQWVMDQSLMMTLAGKLRTSVSKIVDKYHATFLIDGKSYKGLQVIREREGKKPLIARWGGISLSWDIQASLNDQPLRIWGGRSEIEKRLLAQQCEYCGTTSDTEPIEVHHIRALKDLNRYPGREKPEWVKMMAYRHRKTMVLCRTCHQDVTFGHPMRRPKWQGGFMNEQPKARHTSSS
jgi:group II intron reverse transcriptase/maturase